MHDDDAYLPSIQINAARRLDCQHDFARRLTGVNSLYDDPVYDIGSGRHQTPLEQFAKMHNRSLSFLQTVIHIPMPVDDCGLSNDGWHSFYHSRFFTFSSLTAMKRHRYVCVAT